MDENSETGSCVTVAERGPIVELVAISKLTVRIQRGGGGGREEMTIYKEWWPYLHHSDRRGWYWRLLADMLGRGEKTGYRHHHLSRDWKAENTPSDHVTPYMRHTKTSTNSLIVSATYNQGYQRTGVFTTK